MVPSPFQCDTNDLAPIPLAPAHGTIPGWLHTDGTWIVNAQNRHVRLASVNWNGAEGPDFVPGGLDRRPYMDILRTIKSLGFNSVRMATSISDTAHCETLVQAAAWSHPLPPHLVPYED